MHAHLLDNYSHLDSPVHRAPAGVKLFCAVGVVILLVVLPASGYLFVAAGAVLVVVAVASRIPAGFLVKRLLLLEPLVLGVAVLMLLQPDGRERFVEVVLRSTLCVLALVLLGNTTPFAQIVGVLKRLRVPGLMVTTLLLMHRYLFVLGEEAQRMQRARACRTFVPGRRRAWKGLAALASQLFLRASARSERIYAAMYSRGWQ